MSDAGAPVLCCPDKFRGSLTAAEAAAAMRRGVERTGRAARALPLADGGEGTLDAILDASQGSLREVRVTGPDGAPVDAAWGLLTDGTAIVEMARASGLALVRGNDPLTATTYGTGELIAAALDAGCRRIIVGVGGSATVDGGLGALEALGWTLRGAEVVVACDVRTSFLDAPRLFGPQKGASSGDVTVLEERLHGLAARLEATFGVDVVGLPGAGAAGGLAGGLAAAGARLVPGFDVVAEAVRFEDALAASAAVVTGEGKVDRTTFDGKVVARVLDAARASGLPAGIVAGAIDPGTELAAPSRALRDAGGDPFGEAAALVEQETAALVGELLPVLTPAEFRELFLLDPDVVFLNHGSFGAVPRPVFEEQERLRRELEAEPVLFLARRLDDRLAAVRAAVGALVHADPDDLGLVPNTTTALNAVAFSLELGPGDEIVTTSHEYGAMAILWDEVSRVTGAEVRAAGLPEPATGPAEIVDAVVAELTERTRVLFCSHVTSLGATVLPVARLCAEARRRGIVSVVDGAHAPGQLELDLDAVGADVYAGNLHKWACSPRGSAFVHVRPELQERIRGPVVSWNWTWDGPDAFRGRFGWPGTVDPTSYLAVPAALAFQREHEWRDVVAACRERLERTVAALEDELGGVPAAAPELRAPQFASVHLDLGGREPDDVQRALWDSYRIEVPVERLGSLTVVRPSVQAYTTDEDCRAFVGALAEVLAAG